MKRNEIMKEDKMINEIDRMVEDNVIGEDDRPVVEYLFTWITEGRKNAEEIDEGKWTKNLEKGNHVVDDKLICDPKNQLSFLLLILGAQGLVRRG